MRTLAITNLKAASAFTRRLSYDSQLRRPTLQRVNLLDGHRFLTSVYLTSRFKGVSACVCR